MGQIAPFSSLAVRHGATDVPAPLARRVRLRQAATSTFGAVAVVGTAAPRGGYFPTSWGWIALVFGFVIVIALAVEPETRLGAAELGVLTAIGLSVGWVALSALWSQSVPLTILEIERDLVFPLGLLAALLIVQRGGIRQLLGGVLAGIVVICVYALGTRLLPDRIGTFDPIAGYRLSSPLGYWNALGAFAGLGILLALGGAAHAKTVAARVLAASSLPVLLPTLYFTFSRGAWIALGFGAVVALVLDPRRLKLVTSTIFVAAPGAAAVWLGSRSAALTRQTATPAQAQHDGHRLLVEILLLALCAAGAALLLTGADRIHWGRGLRRSWAALLVSAVAAILVVGVVRHGGPTQVVRKGYDSFTGRPIDVKPGQNLTTRLFTLSNDGRLDLWRTAWHEYRAHPWLGSGAGTFQLYWVQQRPYAAQRRNAHSLYLEALGGLGPVGLALLVSALLLPLGAAVRARRHPFVPAAGGAYAVYLLHTGADWDWQIAGLTLTALLCAAALLRAGRGVWAVPFPASGRAVLGVAVAIIVVFAVVGEIGNTAVASAARAAGAGQWRREESQARRAVDWAPWSSEARRRLAEAQYSLGRRLAARATLKTAIGDDPRNWQLWLDLAVTERGKARRRALNRALKLNPLSPEIADARAELGLPPPRSGA